MSDNEEDLYDEFGNYIGPDLDDDSDDDDDDDSEKEGSSVGSVGDGDAAGGNDDNNEMVVVRDDEDDEENNINQQQIVLHEDKEHYESAEQVYGPDVTTVLLDEDAMDLDTPIIEPLKTTQHTVSDKQLVGSDGGQLEYIYSDDYLGVQFANETCRNRRGVAIIGHLHHGKTTLMDMLIENVLVSKQKHSGGAFGPKAALNDSSPRYLDILQMEQQRNMSLTSTPITLLLPDSRGKLYCITAIDCPGHVNFHDETVAALQIVDGAVIVVDIVEEIQLHTVMCIKHAIQQGLSIVLIINKLDRLIIELKLPPNDAYYKILHVIDTMNDIIQKTSNRKYPILTPSHGNVAFASGQHGWLFTLSSFATVMTEHYDNLGTNLSVNDLAQRLWGDTYLDPETKQFKKKPTNNNKRTFVQFVLEPIYKIYSACLGEREQDVNKLLRSIGVLLSKEQLRSSTRPLIRTAMSKFLQTSNTGGFVDLLVRNIPNPISAAVGKLARCYTGPIHDNTIKVVKAMKECDPYGPLVIHCVKNYTTADGDTFWTLGRIYSGTVRPAETVKVLGEAYTPQDDEDAAIATIAAVAIPRGRIQTQVSLAKAGNWVLLQGVDSTITKTATIISNNMSEDDLNEMHIFAPLKFQQAGDEAIIKLAIEPLNPSELPKMVEGLRRISKAYPMVKTKVEESGEHVVMGTGELYMDCVMHDLRHVYSNIEVKVADPVVAFRETVVETSSLKCFAETANKRNKLTYIAEPMDDGLAEQLEAGKINLNWDKKKLGRYFQTKYNWDLLSSRSVWAFGDSPTHGTNILLDDTLPSEVDKTLLNSCRSSIVQGFQWATREGPLCEEPVRATKIKILDATLADKPIYRGGGQIIPTSRRTVHSAILTATPRLMEPVYRLEIQCPGSIVESIQPVLTRRRGHIVQDRPIPGTTLCIVKGFLPVLDSFGFETDLRTFTQGQAMVYSVFDHWSIVPGDPLDKDVILHPLEPSPTQFLARELLVKTRRRKGLSEDVSINKFFDEGMKNYLASQQQQQQQSADHAPMIEMLQ